MNFKTFRTTAAMAALVLGIGISSTAHAQTTVTSTLTTNSAITVVDGNDIDFGTWLIIVRNGETVTLTMDNTGAVATGGITQSTVQDLTSSSAPGTLTVDLPAGTANTVLQMERTAASAFADGGLSLTGVTYSTATEGNNQAFVVTPATEPVTVVAGGTPETVTFGTQISASATPADGAHTSSFDVTFAY